jgi:hypothetical protein
LALVKALVRAHDWYQKVVSGKVLDQRALSREAGLTERYVGRVTVFPIYRDVIHFGACLVVTNL